MNSNMTAAIQYRATKMERQTPSASGTGPVPLQKYTFLSYRIHMKVGHSISLFCLRHSLADLGDVDRYACAFGLFGF
jgi:hypothetical protein